jgi:hypothetical protein
MVTGLAKWLEKVEKKERVEKTKRKESYTESKVETKNTEEIFT